MSWVATAPRVAMHVRAGMAHSANWWQVARFLTVGASGFAINLAVFATLVQVAGVDYRLAAVCSNLIALTSNFLCNRHWTFAVRGGPAALQARRFALVSVCGLLVNLVVLHSAAEFLSLSELPSEILASAIAAPVNFLGSRQWAFRSGRSSRIHL